MLSTCFFIILNSLYWTSVCNKCGDFIVIAVTREQISTAPQVDDNNLPNFQMPDMLDSYACEMFLNGFSIDGINIFGDNLFGDGHNSSLSDLEFFATNLICDLPTLEDTIEAVDHHYGGSCEEFLQMSDPSWFQLICHQAKPIEEPDVKSSQFDSARVDYSDPEAFIRNILDLSDESNSLPGLVSEETGNMKHITLVLDLDGNFFTSVCSSVFIQI